MFADPHSPVVLAGRLVQSAFAQQPAVGTQRLVPEQFLNPFAHAMAHVPAVHTAVPFDAGDAHVLQPEPQNVVLVSDWQTPLQLCVPVGQVPLQATAFPMHAPLHSVVPLGHPGTHASPSHETVPCRPPGDRAFRRPDPTVRGRSIRAVPLGRPAWPAR